MSTNVLEALQNAQINFETIGKAGLSQHPIFMIAMSQLGNAIDALENGKSADDVIQDSMFSDVNTG